MRGAIGCNRELHVDPAREAQPLRFARIAGRHFAHPLQRFRLHDLRRKVALLLRGCQLRLQRFGRVQVRDQRVDAAEESACRFHVAGSQGSARPFQERERELLLLDAKLVRRRILGA